MTLESALKQAKELAKYFDWDSDSEQVLQIHQALVSAHNNAIEAAAGVADMMGDPMSIGDEIASAVRALRIREG